MQDWTQYWPQLGVLALLFAALALLLVLHRSRRRGRPDDQLRAGRAAAEPAPHQAPPARAPTGPSEPPAPVSADPLASGAPAAAPPVRPRPSPQPPPPSAAPPAAAEPDAATTRPVAAEEPGAGYAPTPAVEERSAPTRPAIQAEQIGPEPPPAPRTLPRYPVVLAHGVLGFDSIELAGVRGSYFRGVVERLQELGVDVHVVRVDPLGSVARRAAQLVEQIERIPAARVNIVAHSMGGLDARYAISRLGLATRVAALVTVGTPHRGTPIADSGTRLLGERLGLKRVLAALGGNADAFWELTQARMASFNSEVTDAPGVFYASYLAFAGNGAQAPSPASSRALELELLDAAPPSSQSQGKLISPLLLPTYLWLSRRVGRNDGLVPIESQAWGDVLGQVRADHWAQIGWAPGFDAAGFYADLVRALGQRGF